MNLVIILIFIISIPIAFIIDYFYNKRQDEILKEYYEERIKEIDKLTKGE